MSGLPFHWLITDLDGTLVDRSLEIVPRSAEALRRFQDAGGTVIIATGRNEQSAARYHSELGLKTPMILYNGARIVDPIAGHRLLDLDLGTSWSSLRDHVLPSLPNGVGALGFSGSSAHVLRPGRGLADFARRDRIDLLEEAPAGRVTKVMLIAERPGLAELAALVRDGAPGVRLLQSESTYLEVLPASAGKGAALQFMAFRYGVSMNEIAAIGDNPNDLDMLDVAGLGVAVGDGHPSVRAAADMVVRPCAEGAVADLVDRLLAPV